MEIAKRDTGTHSCAGMWRGRGAGDINHLKAASALFAIIAKEAEQVEEEVDEIKI